MDQKLRDTIRRFYDGHLTDRHGDPQDPLCLGWTSRERQEIRFEVLCAAAGIVPVPAGAPWTVRTDGETPKPWTPKSGAQARILDAGCGFGDLYGWLAERGARCAYRGADLLPKMVATARTKWPAAEFDLGDPADLYPAESFDWALASGYVCVYAGQARVGHLRETAAALLALSREGAAFNLLDARHVAQEGALLTYHPQEAFAACAGLGADVEIVEGYLANDFTVVLQRK